MIVVIFTGLIEVSINGIASYAMINAVSNQLRLQYCST